MKYLVLLILPLLFGCSDDQLTFTDPVIFQLAINSQADLENFDFSAIDSIKGPLSIMNTDANDLSFLSEICVTGRVDIFGNESLTSLDGIERINCISSLVIEQNRNLRNIQALENLEISENFNLKNNGLEQIESISSLNSVSNQIFIAEENLVDFKIFKDLTQVNSLVLLRSQTENLDDLQNLELITEEIRITGNPRLSDFCGIKNALESSPNIDFEIQSNQVNPTQEEIISSCN